MTIADGVIVFASTDFSNDTAPPVRHLIVTDLGGHVLTDVGIAQSVDPGDLQIQLEQLVISANGRYLTFWATPTQFNPEDGSNTPASDAAPTTASRTIYHVIATRTATDDQWWGSMSNDSR